MEKCWVPICPNIKSSISTKQFFLLPSNPKTKEIWIALAGKRLAGNSQATIYFCEDHFIPTSWKMQKDKALSLKKDIPCYNIPQKLCQTCMCQIGEQDLFCILSKTIPSKIPSDINSELLACRPEPLYQILTFCIPDLTLCHDPPPLVCYKCYNNIWLYFYFKVTCNAVEKGLRGNLAPAEYGQMVLCRTCPQTYGTSFFTLDENTLMGILLKRMFLNDYPPDVVPLKVCLKCWNTLYKLKNFYEQCIAAEKKMQRHNLLLGQSGLTNVDTSSTTIPTYSGKVESLRSIRRKSQTICHPYQNINSEQNDAAHSSLVQFNVGNSNIGTVSWSSGNNQMENESEMSRNASVIKFIGTNEQAENSRQSDSLQPQKPQEGYERGSTWFPPIPNVKPVITQKANLWVPPVDSTQSPIFQIETNLNTPVRRTRSTFKEENNIPQIFISSVNSNIKTNSHVLETVDCGSQNISQCDTLKNNQIIDIRQTESKTWFSNEEKISLAKLMLKYGEPLKCQGSPENQFDAWINIVKEFHRINNNQSLESIQEIWKEMKMTAQFAFLQIGPAMYQDQLVIEYLYSNFFNNDIEISEENAAKSSRKNCINTSGDLVLSIAETIANNERILKSATMPNSTSLSKRKREKPKRNEDEVWSEEPHSSTLKKQKSKRGRKRLWNEGQKLEFLQAMKEEFDKCLKNNEPTSDKSIWSMILHRLKSNGKYRIYTFSQLYYVWYNMRKSATMHKKDHNIIHREVRQLLQAESAMQNNSVCIKSEIAKTTKHSMPNTKVMSSLKTTPTKLHPKNCQKRPVKTLPASGKGSWSQKQKLELVRAMREQYDKCLKNNELPNAKSLWQRLLEQLIVSKYKKYNFRVLYNVWGRMKRSATIYEKNGDDPLDEEVWQLLQLPMQNNIKNSIRTEVAKVRAEMEEENMPVTEHSDVKNTKSSTPSLIKNSEDTKSSTSNDNDSVSNTTSKISVPTLNMSEPKLNKETKYDKENFNCWTESEKIEFFKLIKQEFNSMIKSKESMSRPWHTIAQRIAIRKYKNCDEDTLYRAWMMMRRNATLHENDRQLSILDCKILRLLKLYHKNKGTKKAKPVKKEANKKKHRENDKVKAVMEKEPEETANSKIVPDKNNQKDVSKTIEDKSGRNNRTPTDLQAVETMDITTNSDEDDAEDNKDEDDGELISQWTVKENINFINLLKRYGRDCFKKRKQKGFWCKVSEAYNAKYHTKRSPLQVRNRWTLLLQSAELAFADQKWKNSCDELIIDFMMEVVETQEKDDECCDNNIANDTSERSSEVNDEIIQDEIQENECTSTTESLTVNHDNTTRSNEEPADDDNVILLNYDYISLEDIERNTGQNILQNVKNEVKTELNCIASIPVEMQDQVIVINDSDEE